MAKKEQIIKHNTTSVFKIGVDYPIILSFSSDSGLPVKISISHTLEEENTFHYENGILDIYKVGTLKIEASQKGDSIYKSASVVTHIIEITEADFFERSQSIIDLKKRLDSDEGVLKKFVSTTIDEVQTIKFSFFQNASSIELNGIEYQISMNFILKKIIRSSLKFFKKEMEMEKMRLQKLIEIIKSN